MGGDRTLAYIAGAVLLIWLGARLMGEEGVVAALVIIGVVALRSHLRGQWRPQPREYAPVPAPAPRKPSEAELRYARYRDEVAALSIEEARRRSESLLAEPVTWEVRKEEVADPDLTQDLAPSLRDLFARYGALHGRYGEARIGGEALGRFEWPGSNVLGFGRSGEARAARFRQIGVDFDGNPLVVKPGEESVYVVHRPESNPARWWCSEHPSVWHWLLMQNFSDES